MAGQKPCEVTEVAPDKNLKKKKGMRWSKGQEPGTARKMCESTLKRGDGSALNSLIAIIGA